VLETRDWETLSGTLSDGSAFAFRQGRYRLSLGNVFADDATLRLTLAPAHDCNNDGVFDIADTLCATPTSIGNILSAANLIRGDADGDGQVGFADFLALSNHFGQEGKYQQGNFDLENGVDFSDFVILSKNFGTSAVAAASVPEPGCFMSLFVGTVLLTRLGRRRSRSTKRLNRHQ
jgi:hypothetical protein